MNNMRNNNVSDFDISCENRQTRTTDNTVSPRFVLFPYGKKKTQKDGTCNLSFRAVRSFPNRVPHVTLTRPRPYISHFQCGLACQRDGCVISNKAIYLVLLVSFLSLQQISFLTVTQTDAVDFKQTIICAGRLVSTKRDSTK